jgi:protein-disulfide isomerase
MDLEKIIKNISSVVAGVVVFCLMAFVYLNSKGFRQDENGQIVLVSAAEAKSAAPKEIPSNYVFPQTHSMGNPNAPVVLYEYSSFGCTHCADFHIETLPELKSEYIDKGLVRLVFVPFPLDKNSMDAALLAECVSNDKYFSFANLLFKKQRDWTLAFEPYKVLMQYAALSGVSNDYAEACLRADKTAERLLTDRQAGITDLGINGTPSFVVSSALGNEMVSGVRSVADFKDILNRHLSAGEKR